MRRKQFNPAFSHNTLVSFLTDFSRIANKLIYQLKLQLLENQMSFQELENFVSRAVLEVSCRKYMFLTGVNILNFIVTKVHISALNINHIAAHIVTHYTPPVWSNIFIAIF